VARRKLERTEQLQPKRYASQKRAGEAVSRGDKEFLSAWVGEGKGISPAMLMDILGLERDGQEKTISTEDARRLIREINRIKEGIPGLALATEDANGRFGPKAETAIKKGITDEVINALIVSGRFKSMKEAVSSLGDPRLDSLAAEFDSRMALDAALLRVRNHIQQSGGADADKIISRILTNTIGRKTELEKRLREGRTSIKGPQGDMIGDAKLSEIVDAANEALRSRGLPEIEMDQMFPRDESGGFVDNLSSKVPGSTSLSSGKRYVARTASSRRAQAMEDASARRQSTGGRMSSGARPLRDPDGRVNAPNVTSRAKEVTLPDGVIARNSASDNISALEKALMARQELAGLFVKNEKNTPGFSVYDFEDELTKAGIPEEDAQKLVDAFVDLDTSIDNIKQKFEDARESMSNSIEEIGYKIDRVRTLQADKKQIIDKWGEENAEAFTSAIDDKISKLLKDIDDLYQTGIGGPSGEYGKLSYEAERLEKSFPGWIKPYGGSFGDINVQLARLEAEITKMGGRKKPVPVTGLDFDVPDGTRLSSGKTEEYFQNLTGHLISMIEKSQKEGGNWEAPWHKVSNLPKNASTKNMYSGGNLFALLLAAEEKGYTTPHWAGFQQWKKLGGSVKKGEKGTLILMPTMKYGESVDDAGNKKRVVTGVYFTTAHVFNLDQVEGIDREEFLKTPTDLLSPEQRVSKLDDAIKEVGALIETGDGSRAYYSPSQDKVVMPPFELFKSPEAYYGTLAHELVHWTGHSSRLDRPNMNQFGSPAYAREELVAEFGSAFVLAMFGLSAEPREDHAHYLANWLQVLREEPNALQEASVKAQAAAKMLIEKMQAVLNTMGETSSDAESDVEVKSLQNFVNTLYSMKEAYVEWASEPFNAPHFIKSLSQKEQSSGLVNRSWERIAETALFLERLSREK
jgi:antirestriction protein ArdC